MDISSILLAGGEIHGFRTLADLDIKKLKEDASTRWFRPNEVYALLTNSTYFTVQPQPVEYPISGSIVLFDRKVLRNFRKDGYKWKKKKDGKTVQEAHEKLKIGNEERIHVYYARGEDDPNFYRRCYWLLDKKLEHIVLVHYRQTVEDNATQNISTPLECKEPSYLARKMYDSSPLTPLNSACGSMQSDLSGSAILSEEINSNENEDIFTGSGIFLSKKHIGHQSNELSLYDIKNLGWADLALASDYIEPCLVREDDDLVSCHGTHEQLNYGKNEVDDSFEQWDDLNDDFIGELTAPLNPNGNNSNSYAKMDDHPAVQQQIFTIIEVSPEWGYSNEETKVVVIGTFHESYKHLITSRIYCAFDDLYVETQMIQPGVYRCIILPQVLGKIDIFLTLDGHTPISQIIPFYSRSVPVAYFDNKATSNEENGKLKLKDVNMQKRLAHLLFSTDFAFLSPRKMQPKAIKEAKKFALLTTPYIENGWKELLGIDCKNEFPSYQDCEDFLELVFKNKLQEWLVEKIADGCKATSRDGHGQGAIHLCTILDYSWAVSLFSLSGFSLDFRDAYGWTALHWAAYLGREKMVASLLSAGADPSLVTDPTPEIPGGLTAADLASKSGHEGLAAYLAEKGLTAHFEAMSLVGNIPSSLSRVSRGQTSSKDLFSDPLLSEQEVCLKESLAAYRNAADAADRIQAAFRERTLKLQTEAVQLAKPEMEASQIIAALRIQHAFRNHSRRRLMKAAARIQSHFRTWRTRKDFLNMRRRAIKIQAAFRGHQVRKQHQKIIWSIGVLEKAILRWRMKRRGLRGMHVESMEGYRAHNSDESPSTMEEFFKLSTKHAEERVRRSVVRVQSMFRSYRAQQEYRRMKLAHEQAKLKFSLNGVAGFH